MPRHAELATISLPDFGLPTVEPVIPRELYARRLDRLRERARAAGFDAMLVYGDREHFANLTYLTGFDPRFEEALLAIPLAAGGEAKPLLLVGNEGLGYARISPILDDLDVILFQSFSLLGQPRGSSRPLDEILRAAGVRLGATVGVAGWKHFDQTDAPGAEGWLEIPAYIADTLRDLTGEPANVRNANRLLMDASSGLRATNEAEQLARFEFAATYASQAVRNVLFGVRPGMTEFDAAGLMHLNGLPLATHIFLSAGKLAYLGMASPTLRRIGRGEPFTVCCSPWGALTTRAGFLVERADELPVPIQDYVNKLSCPISRPSRHGTKR
jgi:Xaa-Pro aminopeptidase